jgi:hypothetical protein
MHAKPGDRIVVRARREHEHGRDGQVLEVRGVDGAPPYLVQWSDSGHEGLYYPSSDAYIAAAT